MVIPRWSFADRIKKARSVVGLQQREFAALIGQKAPAYAQWEAGNNRPRDIVAVAEAIERVTSVPAWWVLGMEDPFPRQAPPSMAGSRPTGREGAFLRACVRRRPPPLKAAA